MRLLFQPRSLEMSNDGLTELWNQCVVSADSGEPVPQSWSHRLFRLGRYLVRPYLAGPKRAFVEISFGSHALHRYRARVGVFVVPNGAVLATSLEALSLGRLVVAALSPRWML
jgi:hypothetical protein